MKHVNCPADVQPFAIPAGRGCVRVNAHPRGRIPSAYCRRSIRWDTRRRWDRRQRTTVRPEELESAIVSSLDLKPLFVNGSMVAPTQQDEIGQRCGPTLSPMLNVVSLAEREITAWEAAAVIPKGERARSGSSVSADRYLLDGPDPGVRGKEAPGLGQAVERFARLKRDTTAPGEEVQIRWSAPHSRRPSHVRRCPSARRRRVARRRKTV